MTDPDGPNTPQHIINRIPIADLASNTNPPITDGKIASSNSGSGTTYVYPTLVEK